MKTSKNPLVSVIMTTKKEEKYIEKTLKAIRQQTYKPIEIVVCDDQSKDNTVAIAVEYGAKVIVRKSNIPQGKNIAARFAKGEFLVFVDADTIIEKNWIKNSLKHLKKKENVMVVGSFRSQEKTFLGDLLCMLWSDIIPGFLRIFRHVGHPGGATFALRKETYEELDGFDETFITFEDADFCWRASKIGNVVFDRKLHSYTSMRRFEKGGYIAWFFKWLSVGIPYVFIHKQSIKTFKAYR